MTQDKHVSARKEWKRPVLQTLPISATSNAKGPFNEGQGKGKGDAGNLNPS